MKTTSTQEVLADMVMEKTKQEIGRISVELDSIEKRYRYLEKEIKEAEGTLHSLDRNDSERRMVEEHVLGMRQEMMDLEDRRKSLEKDYDILQAGRMPEHESDSSVKKKFDKYRCFRNIRFLLEQKDVRLGDIERGSGNNAGYMSRLEKATNATDPSIEFLVNAAKMLGVSMDDLLFGTFKELSPNEISLLKFLQKLTEKTKDDEQYWEKETWQDHIKYADWCEGNTHPHPLYGLDYEEDGDGGAYPDGYSYHSRFYPRQNIVIEGMCFHAVINENDDEIYVMNCAEQGPDVESDLPFYEVYHIDGQGNIHPMCCTREERNQIHSAVDKLYGQIQESLAHVRLSAQTKNMITSFLG